MIGTMIGLVAVTPSLVAEEPKPQVLIAAHRGGYENDMEDEAPENSVANIRVCEKRGYQLYETDIQRTKDGHFVIVHDPTIDRETTGSGKVSEMTLAEVKALHKRYRNGSVSEKSVATLDEFLEEGKGRVVFKADLKPGVSDHFEEIMEVVIKHDAMKGVIFRVPYRQAEQFAQFKADGVPYAKGLLMFMVSSKAQVDDIKAIFESRWIQINVSRKDPSNAKTLELIRYATSQGMQVETHAEGDAEDWIKLVEAGVRMFHASGPSKVKAFLMDR